MTIAYPLVIVSGPSGSGKSTVIARLLALGDLPLHLSVSATTRPPRPGELDGVHYHFWSEERFAEEVRHGGFLEEARVHGYRYGTLKREVDTPKEQGRIVILDIDIQGAATVRRQCSDVVSIFLRASSLAAYEVRLRARHTEDEKTIRKRLAAVEGELAHAPEYDYQVVNDDLDKAVQEIHGILKRLEKTVHAR
jgi:guanylate kinase